MIVLNHVIISHVREYISDTLIIDEREKGKNMKNTHYG